MGTYKIKCKHCSETIEFGTDDVPDLVDDIENQCDFAASEARGEVYLEYSDWVNPDEVCNDDMKALSHAIHNGNREEAEYILDRIAAEYGCTEAVQRGRYAKRVMV